MHLDAGIDCAAVLKKALSNGGEYADIFIERSELFSLSCEDGKIEKVVSGTDCGAGVRLIREQRTVYAHTNELTTEALLELADALRKAAPGSGREITIDLSRKKPKTDYSVARDLSSFDVPWKKDMVLRANAAARAVDPRIRQAMLSYREQRQKVFIANSDGFSTADERSYITAAVHVVAADGALVQTGYDAAGGNTGMEVFEGSPMERVAENAARRAVLMLSARPAPAGRMPVVLSSEAGGTMIHEAVGHGLEADLAQGGLSVYSGRIGEAIASPLVTVVDDATLAGRRGSFRFDDEGNDAERTVLVEEGVLKTFLYDRLTAMKDGVRSTGNGRRESYRRRPIPRMTNTMIAPGGSDPAEILRSTPSGLFVRKMGGGQVNTVNGDFVFEVSEGYMIDNGKIGEAVRGATLLGNGPQALRSIDLVGSDLGFSIGTCGKDGQGAPVSDAQPTLRIPELTVGGIIR
jgi:TldD protein